MHFNWTANFDKDGISRRAAADADTHADAARQLTTRFQ